MMEAVRMSPSREKSHCDKYVQRIYRANKQLETELNFEEIKRLESYIQEQKAELKQWREAYKL